MGQLRAPGVGPIVGHTTDRSCKLWVRADTQGDPDRELDPDRRTIGVLGIVREGGRKRNPVPCYYFRLHREFDRSGCINLGAETPTPGAPKPLRSDTLYEVRIGTLTLDDPADNAVPADDAELLNRLPSPRVWKSDLMRLPAERSEAVFRTFPKADDDGGRLDFLIGSCRYPGLMWKIRHSDRIFGPMGDLVWHAGDDGAPRFVLMVGDQVYADLFNRAVPLGRADTYDEFRERYLTAFSSRNMRRLLRRTPTYMILDDHEIEDNWTQDRLRRDAKYQLFTIAIDAYLSYQWSHGPRSYGKRLYYRFDYGGFPFFVLDTRTQRYLEGEKGVLADNHMLGRPTLPGSPPGQLARLLSWLNEQQAQRGNVPKFIVSSSVFVPSPMRARAAMSERQKEESDSWPGFPVTRRAILSRLIDGGVQNVVFLSGDIHCANIARMWFSGTPEAERITAYSVTSSAFYWPFPFADGEPSDFVHDSTQPGQEDTFVVSESPRITMDYRAWNFTQEDNFCRLTVDRASHKLRVRTFDRYGQPVAEEQADGSKAVLDETLDLVPW